MELEGGVEMLFTVLVLATGTVSSHRLFLLPVLRSTICDCCEVRSVK